MRLNRYIAQTGLCSRRKADDLITQKRVVVNGETITDFSYAVATGDTVEVDGKLAEIPTDFMYILLRKPMRTITTVSDTHGRKTVLDLIKTSQRVYPVGRLDYETTGVLLLTNDGNLTNALIHPSKHVEKEYLVRVNRTLTETELARLRRGVRIEDYTTRPCDIGKVERLAGGEMQFVMTLKEGKKRQIRRMIKAVKADVSALDRITFAGLDYRGLAEGEYRALTPDEISHLKHEAGNL